MLLLIISLRATQLLPATRESDRIAEVELPGASVTPAPVLSKSLGFEVQLLHNRLPVEFVVFSFPHNDFKLIYYNFLIKNASVGDYEELFLK